MTGFTKDCRWHDQRQVCWKSDEQIDLHVSWMTQSCAQTYLMQDDVGVDDEVMTLLAGELLVVAVAALWQDSFETGERGAQMTGLISTWDVIADISLPQDLHQWLHN